MMCPDSQRALGEIHSFWVADVTHEALCDTEVYVFDRKYLKRAGRWQISI